MAEFAFQRAASQLGSEALTLRNPRDCTLETVDLALGKLRALGRSPRERIVLACSVGMTTDREINQDEALLLRGICADLGFAPPTLLPGQPVLPGA